MINKENYKMNEVDGEWALIKTVDDESAEQVLVKRTERKYIALIYDGILSNQYETEEELKEDIDNIPAYTERITGFIGMDNCWIQPKYVNIGNGTTITYTTSISSVNGSGRSYYGYI